MSVSLNSIAMNELLPNLFSKQKHFTPQEYYEEVLRLFPQLEMVEIKKFPSEKQIQKWIAYEQNFYDLEGQTTVPQAEKQLGIKIGEDYTYPENMNSFEYNRALFYKSGFLEYTDYHVSAPKSLKEAYMCAWQNLHFHNFFAKDRLKNTAMQYETLCQFNPQVRNINFDKQNEELLLVVCDGVIYGYPPADIQLFVTEVEKGNTAIASTHSQRIADDIKASGLPDWFNFQWVPSTETIRKAGASYLEKLKTNEATLVIKQAEQLSSASDVSANEEICCVATPETTDEGDMSSCGWSDNKGEQAEVIYSSLRTIKNMTAFYSGEDTYAKNLMKIYLEDVRQMTVPSFWKRVAADFAKTSSVSENVILNNVMKFSVSLAKEVEQYGQDTEYLAIKQKCARGRNYLKTAQYAMNKASVWSKATTNLKEYHSF